MSNESTLSAKGWEHEFRNPKSEEDDMRGKEPTFDGARLRAMRKQRGLSVHNVELRAGVTARHVWRLEAGKRPNVAAVTLARIAVAVGVDINYLLGLSDSPRPGD
jgi:DNA-binding Xre family transcriptional regulator